MSARCLVNRKHQLTLGGQPSPRQIAQTRVLFPVPFGPITMFKFGPGKNSAEVYVTKFDNLTRTMEPGWCPPERAAGPVWRVNCELRIAIAVPTDRDVSSAEESSSSESRAFLRMRLLSLGAVEEGVFG